ncbi:hypothetical protein DIE03_25750, partial [Burkholderia sp. Bp8992]
MTSAFYRFAGESSLQQTAPVAEPVWNGASLPCVPIAMRLPRREVACAVKGTMGRRHDGCSAEDASVTLRRVPVSARERDVTKGGGGASHCISGGVGGFVFVGGVIR